MKISGLEVIKLEFSLKINLNDWLLADRCVRKHPLIALYFEFENDLKFYNPKAWSEVHLNICSNGSKTQTFSRQKIVAR